jgi:hypothetical protein
MSPGWDSDWWGRDDPIEQAGEEPMKPWEELADTLEHRQGLRWAFNNWKAEGERLKAIAPLDFLEAVAELTDDLNPPRHPSVHRQSA